jgi:hypothetical protein
VEYYFNPYMLDGGQKIPIRIHPFLPAGTILGWSDRLPVQYQSNDVPNTAEVRERQGLVPNRLADHNETASGRRVRRGSANGLRPVRNECLFQHCPGLKANTSERLLPFDFCSPK